VTSVLIALEYTDRLTFYVTPYRSQCWYATAFSAELVVSDIYWFSEPGPDKLLARRIRIEWPPDKAPSNSKVIRASQP
jgi:hypothetical protein